MRAGVDLDGVVADLRTPFIKVINKEFDLSLKHEDITSFYLADFVPGKDWNDIKHIWENPEFILKQPLLPWARWGINRLRDLGYAILNYMRARRLDPSNEDILHNLEFARRFSRVQMEGVELNPISSFMSMIVNPYRLNILAWVSSVCFILFVLIMIFRFGLGYNSSLIRISAILSLIFIMISFGLTTFKYRQDYLTRRGVVVAEEVSVYTGPSILSDVELEAAPGLVIEILDENQEYYNVLFENKRRGWVEKDLIAEL